ncbi:MAG: OmpH family outer membrane protein [Pseudomonadota bacterium]
MKKVSVLFIMMVCFLGFISNSFGADVAKIGIVDYQRILDESSGGKIIEKQISDKNIEIRKQLIDEKDQIDKMTKDFQRESLVLSSEKQDEKARDIRIRQNDAIKLEKKLTLGFKQLQAELFTAFQKEVSAIVSEIGKKEGYLLILEKKQGAVIFAQDHVDITDMIIKLYNKKTAK